MRKYIIAFFSSIISAMVFMGCSNISNVKSTELNNIFIDNLNIGSSIKNINLRKYTESNRDLGDYTCKFEELIIDSEDNRINYLFGKFDENRTIISINDNRNLKNVNAIRELLGENYQEKWKDREQNLREYIYFDKVNNIKAEFVYCDYDGSLAWVILSQINNLK